MEPIIAILYGLCLALVVVVCSLVGSWAGVYVGEKLFG